MRRARRARAGIERELRALRSPGSPHGGSAPRGRAAMKVETIHEQLLFSVVRLQTERAVGTGFIMHHYYEDGVVPFLVTNKHVVAGAETLELFVHLKGSDDGPVNSRCS